MATDIPQEGVVPTLGSSVIHIDFEDDQTIITLVDKYGSGTRVHLSDEQTESLVRTLGGSW